MNDNRFGRAAYKNLLSTMGSTLIASTAGASTANSNIENVLVKSNTLLNLKSSVASAALQQQNLTVSSSSSSIVTSCSIASNPQAASAAVTSQSYNALQSANASIRNALGDIGNRIGLVSSTASSFAITKPVAATTKVSVEPIASRAERELLSAPKLIAELQEPAPNSNNTCVMIEDEEEEPLEAEGGEQLVDIDKFDAGNTQLVAEYVNDVYAYLGELEKQYRIAGQFMESKIVTAKMRSVLIDWLIQVHLKFQLLQETLYLCVFIIDSYLQAVDVPKMQLQLVGVTAMFLASKYEEMYVPAIDDFVYMTDNTYTKHEIRQMEINILKTLNFLLCKPLPLHFLRRFSKAGQADPKHHTLAKYFMELSLHDAEFSSMDPSYLAACSLHLSFKLLSGPRWNKTLEHYSTYKANALTPGMQKLGKLVLKSMSLDYKYRAATNKYGQSKFMRISLLPELGSNLMKEIATGHFSN